MENVWITLITVAGGIIATLISFLVWKSKHSKKIQEKQETEINKLKELCNYGYGCIDMINQASIKVNPEVREAMRQASKRYHAHDLTSLKKDTKKQKEKKEAKNG